MSTLLHDLPSQSVIGASSYPATVSTSDVGASVDLIEADGRCFAIQVIGAVSGTSPTLAGKIQESADNSTFTDIAGATFSTVSASSNLQVISFERTKRYVRYSRAVAGTSPSFAISVVIGEQKKSA
jgi:hypothetical protein